MRKNAYKRQQDSRVRKRQQHFTHVAPNVTVLLRKKPVMPDWSCILQARYTVSRNDHSVFHSLCLFLCLFAPTLVLFICQQWSLFLDLIAPSLHSAHLCPKAAECRTQTRTGSSAETQPKLSWHSQTVPGTLTKPNLKKKLRPSSPYGRLTSEPERCGNVA